MAKTDPVIFETLTLDQLKAERPDIAEAYQAEVKAQMEAAADAERIAAEEAAAAANAGKETPEQIEARIRADAVTKANARAVEVATMCSKNGMTAKLAEYIGSDKDVGEIAKSILNERVAGGAGDTNNRHNGGHGNPAAVVDTNEVWSKWNAPKH